jgi:hypothetical protein
LENKNPFSPPRLLGFAASTAIEAAFFLASHPIIKHLTPSEPGRCSDDV